MKTPLAIAMPADQPALPSFLCSLILLLFAASSHANLIIKAPTGTDLANGASWAGSAPTTSDVAGWTNSSLGAGLTLQSVAYWGGISVSNALSDISLTGNWGVIELGAGGIDMSASAVNFNLGVAVILTTNQTWNVNSGEALNVSGTINGPWSVVKNGGGKLTLSADNPITGVTTVNQGTVLISGQIHYNENWQHLHALTINSGGTVLVSSGNADTFLGQCNYEATNNTINGGVLEFNTASGTGEPIERAFSIGTNGGTISVLNTNATLAFNYFSDPMQFTVPAPASLTLAGSGYGIMYKTITGYGGLVKTGSGTWTLNGTNTYAGPTIISNGALAINAALWNSSVTVGPGGKLGGTALIPGSITFLPGAQAEFTAGSNAAWGGTLTLNSNTVHLTMGNLLAPGAYPLAAYLAGGSSGVFNSVPVIDSGSLAAGCTARIQTDRGNVRLVVLPPPAPHLTILSVAGGSNAIAGVPFGVAVQAQDTNGNPWNVAANTPVVLSLASGYGSLGGNLTGSIPAGGNSTMISGVTYTLDEGGVIIAATDASGILQPGNSNPFIVSQGPATGISLLSDANCTGPPATTLPNPILVTVKDPGGNPVAGAGVTFNMASTPPGASGQSLSITNATTDANGEASSVLTLGNKLGPYIVTVALNGPNTNQLSVTATAANGKWVQVWSDEFNYSGLPDSNKWNYEIGYVRNGENQYYTSNRLQNACVTNGTLIITARKEAYIPPGQLYPAANYTSASLITLAKESWTYGRLETRAKEPLPMGGVWTAFWTQGTNFPLIGWPLCGELDVCEYVNWNPNPHGNAFWGYNGGAVGDGKIFYTTAPYNDFHIYAAEWTSQQIDYFYDNTNYYTIYLNEAGAGPSNPFRNPQYILLDFALGGAWGGTIYDPGLPQQFQIDYVRVYQQRPTWTGSLTNALWSFAGNWTNGVLPAPGSTVVFAGGAAPLCTVDGSYSPAGVTFYETAGTNSMNATNGGTLTLTGGRISNYSTNTQTLNVPIELAANLTVDADPGGLCLGGVTSGAGFGLNKTGAGTLTLGAANSYGGATAIQAGTLALAVGASLNSSAINIAAGATLDVSACGNFALPTNALVTASGQGTAIGVSAACLVGGQTNVVSLGSNPISLLCDGADPALVVRQGTLSLAGNSFTVNSTNGLPLPPGAYPLIVQTAGNMVVHGAFPAAGGSAVGRGQTGFIVVSNNVLNLVIAPASTVWLKVPVIQPAQTIQLTFLGIDSSQRYRVQVSSNLASPNWTTLFINIAGTNGAAAIIDTGATNCAERFYRVVTP